MGLFDGILVERSLPPISYPTGTMYDLQLAGMERGYDGKWYTLGGISRGINGIVSGSNMYKSTWAGSLVTRSKIIHSAGLINADSEVGYARDKQREARLPDELAPLYTPDNVVYIDNTNPIEVIEEVVDQTCANKNKERKDYIIEAPFIDPETGKRMLMWRPTYVVIDTWTNFLSLDEKEMQAKGLDDSKNNTIFMKGGQKKTIYLPKLNIQAHKYGLCVILVCHIGKQSTMGQTNPNVPPPKQLQYMRQGEQIKGAGSQFDRLTNPLLQIMSAKKLQASDGSCEYNWGSTDPDDLNEIAVRVLRNKTMNSGKTQPYVVSQLDGLLNSITNYHYLRSNKYYGLLGNMQRHQCALYPEVTLTRNSARGLAAEDQKLRRALELEAQYLFIQNSWNISRIPYDFTKTPEQIREALEKKSKELVDRVLLSRGYWSAGATEAEGEYLSIFDVLEMIQ